MNINISGSLLLLLSLVMTNAHSENVAEMSRYCGMPNGNTLKTHCYSYISGIIDTQANYGLTNHNKTLYTCFPQSITASQGAAIFIKWANNNPELHHEPAFKGIIQSLYGAFPCPTKN